MTRRRRKKPRERGTSMKRVLEKIQYEASGGHLRQAVAHSVQQHEDQRKRELTLREQCSRNLGQLVDAVSHAIVAILK